jgi:DNA helicase TIP49 (TBP-interacting protein)
MYLGIVPDMSINMSDEDFAAVYEAVQFFNEMGEDSDINYSLDLLEIAQEILDKYVSQINPS